MTVFFISIPFGALTLRSDIQTVMSYKGIVASRVRVQSAKLAKQQQRLLKLAQTQIKNDSCSNETFSTFIFLIITLLEA